jgi:hypothetical protein
MAKIVASDGDTAAVLNGRLELHGLDVEPFVERIVDASVRSRNIEIFDAHRREDLLAYVVSELWVASRKFDERRYRSFGQFADAVARRKTIDWLRLDVGRTTWRFSTFTHERPLPDVLRLDSGGDHQLDIPDAGVEGDLAISRADLSRVLTT